jgi:hypothetical protein
MSNLYDERKEWEKKLKDLQITYDFYTSLFDIPVFASNLVKEGTVLVVDGPPTQIVFGTMPLTEKEKWIKDTIKSIFREGKMLDWYEYIGE